ncbi:MAG: radical SAM family heme chaperone HemW [Bacteroidales bacterium]|jgi:oxygen-independent coproporphyrinogen-3 oxidase
MAGIYIHIPFCKSKCHYCNFYSLASSRYVKDFIPALIKEIELHHNYLEGETIDTIYFGGGTPSLLEYDSMMQVFDKLQQTFVIAATPEITLEANPDDLNTAKLKAIRQTPVNRLSIGIQSFFDDDLKYLNRIHTASQAEAAVKRSQDNGFENISIDLIYGIPTLTDDKWKQNLEHSFSLSVPHISAYSLTVEPKTALDNLIRKGKSKPVNEEQSINQFKILMNEMKLNDFTHYEISNFCKEGFISIHNSNYWKGGRYLGLGPSAHSFNLQSRQWNNSNIVEYIKKIETSAPVVEKETLSERDKFNEYIMTSLRTMWGCDLNYIASTFGPDTRKEVEKRSELFITKEQMMLKNDTLYLTDIGKLFADGIAADLFR